MKKIVNKIKNNERKVVLGVIVTLVGATVVANRNYTSNRKMLETLLDACEDLELTDQITDHLTGK